MNGSNTLRAVTWGRGLWEYSLDGRENFPAILTTTITDPPTDIKPLVGVDQYVTSVISYNSAITSAYVEWSINTPVFGNVISMSNTLDSTWVSNLPIPNQPAGTKVYFKVFAVGSNGDTTETYKFMYRVYENDYCQSYGNMSWTTAVTLVDFNTILNATGKTQPYTDYTSTDSTTLVTDTTYSLSINLDTDGNYTIFSKVWIDWNRDFDFEDAGEEYDLGSAINTPDGPTTLSPLSIPIPTDAQPGKTIMRVSAKYNSSPNPCETGFDGEVEDYSIIVKDWCNENKECIWTGAIDSNWNNEGNWICGVPDVTKDVIIPSGTVDCILFSGQSGICKSLTVDSAAKLIVQPNGNLEVEQ